MNSKSGPFIHTQPGKTSFTQYIFHEHVVHCALEIRCKTSCKKCHTHSIHLQFPFLIYAHFFVAKTIYALFCHKKNLCTLFLSRTQFTRFFAKTIYALRPESFCALKVAIRKVQTFGPLVKVLHIFFKFFKEYLC